MEYIIPEKFIKNKKKCSYCGEMKYLENFKKKSTSGFYNKCSECKKNKIIKHIGKEPVTKKCEVCKEEYKTKNKRQRFCSKECREKAYSHDYQIKNGGVIRYYKIRFEVFKRDDFTCQYCGRNVKDDKIKLHCDHVFPENKGGKWEKNNLVTSCEECNLGKSDVLLNERVLNKM